LSSATAAGIGALLLWAFLAVLTRMAAGLPPLQLTALAFAVAGLLGLVWLAATRRLVALRQRPHAWARGVGGLFGYHALYFAALAFAPAVEANLLNYLWPLLIVLLSAPVLGLRLGPARLAGVAMGFAGCALLLGGGLRFDPAHWFGFACAIGAAFTWAVYSVTARRMAAVPTEALVGFCLASAALGLLAHAGFENWVWPDARQALGVLLLGLGPVGAAFFLWDRGMKQGDPRLLGTLAYAVPVASTLLLILAGEAEWSWMIGLSLALVAGGGWVASRARG